MTASIRKEKEVKLNTFHRSVKERVRQRGLLEKSVREDRDDLVVSEKLVMMMMA